MGTKGMKLPPKARDLVGTRFGNLVVVGRATNAPKSGNARWNCICDCGNETTSYGTDLNHGRTTSCGCGAAKTTAERHAKGRDLVGRRFGRLVVLAFAGLDDYPRATWLCRCDCGVTEVVRGSHLTGGNTVSCGCAKPLVMRAVRQACAHVVNYRAAHWGVKAARGPASTHLCVDCLGPAEDWSYDHDDPNQHFDERGRPYSMKPEHYWPRCRRCHKFFDSTVTRTASEVAREREEA